MEEQMALTYWVLFGAAQDVHDEALFAAEVKVPDAHTVHEPFVPSVLTLPAT